MAVKRSFVLFILISMFTLGETYAQYLRMQSDVLSDFSKESELYRKGTNNFPSIRPLYYEDVYANDTSMQFDTYFTPLLKAEYKELKFLSRIEPSFEGTLSNQNVGMLSMSSMKLTTFTQYKSLSLQLAVNVGTLRSLSYTKEMWDEFTIVPEYGIKPNIEKLSHQFIIPEIALHTTPSKYITAEAGFGKHFFGDGHRSLILSDSHFSYPYLNISAQIWKIKYVSMFTWLNDIYYPQARSWNDGMSKFMALHYLSWNMTKRLNFSLFEAVVAPLYDSLMPRQFAEYNYFLPVVMYRPLDFSIGSNDNMLVGANLSYTFSDNHVLYAQFVFDELFVNELRADILHVVLPDSNRLHGAWVNKQAYQFGYKAFDFLSIPRLDILTEINMIRPYMYSHRDVMQNYSHMNQPLAHPLGANLKEFYSKIQYHNNKWYVRLSLSRTIIGLDSIRSNVGQNIFLVSFDARIPELDNIPVQYYGNKIGQGLKSEITFINVSLSRLLLPEYNIFAEVGCIYRKQQTETFATSRNMYFYTSIRWGIGNYKIDY
jgi:hypothetical protein